jgi:uncharacterized UBP type Zn finger protein
MSEQEQCTHLDRVQVLDVPSKDAVAGCEECLKIGGQWVHLRVCRTCGTVGCCDSSPNRHASAHAREEGHPIITTIEPGEDWSWCFIDEVGFALS